MSKQGKVAGTYERRKQLRLKQFQDRKVKNEVKVWSETDTDYLIVKYVQNMHQLTL